MPILKHISIHTTPKATLRYIMNGDKTDECKFITGLNLTEDLNLAYSELQTVFENCSGERFYKKSADSGKNRIRLHHYIQSFAAGEVTPEQAHDFGVEWAKRVFGENRQIMICTHVNTKHIHNHIAVAVYDLDRKIWYDNKNSLKRCRDISDEIARERNIKIIEKPKKRGTVPYNEWLARQNGTSWKVKMADDIDRIILQENVKNIEDFKRELEKAGYDVEQKKYISAKPKYIKNRKPMMTLKLGDGYGMEEILYRIENKNREISVRQINSYSGIQRDYAICLREMQIAFYRKTNNSNNVTYGELRKNTDLLTFICEHKFTSVSDFENAVNDAADKVRKKKYEIERLERSGDENALFVAKKKMSELTAEKNELARAYKQYIEIMKSDYEKMLDRLKERYGADLKDYGVRRDFIDTIKKMSAWSDEVQRKVEREKYAEEQKITKIAR